MFRVCRCVLVTTALLIFPACDGKHKSNLTGPKGPEFLFEAPPSTASLELQLGQSLTLTAKSMYGGDPSRLSLHVNAPDQQRYIEVRHIDMAKWEIRLTADPWTVIEHNQPASPMTISVYLQIKAPPPDTGGEIFDERKIVVYRR